MKRRINKSRDRRINVYLIIESFLIIISALLSFIIVEFTYEANLEYSSSHTNLIYRALGLVIPMALILGIMNHIMSKWTYGYVTLLMKGIERIANGEFKTKLDLDKAGPFLSVYVNFNKMAAELDNLQTLRNDFIDNYSHEFKTPITSINGFAELLLDTDVSDEEKHQYLQIIYDESNHLAKMADSAILLSKLNAQQIIPDKKPYWLDEQIRYCVILLSPEWTKKKIEFTGELEPIVIFGNKELMHHLWINLINNAIKFTPEGGSIKIKASETRNKITVEISDTGIGMNEEDISHIYDQYYQAKTAYSNQGLGLGLSIVKRVVELYNGIINVNSVEGKGTTFIVTLPK